MRSPASGSETVPTVLVGDHAMVNPTAEQVVAAASHYVPALTTRLRGAPARWRPLIVTIGLALLWIVLAARSPTTTYHLAPLLVAASSPVAHRWRMSTSLPPRRAFGLAMAGLAIALVTTAGLIWQGLLAGPDVTGGGRAGTETILVAIAGAALGWWLSRRGLPDMADR